MGAGKKGAEGQAHPDPSPCPRLPPPYLGAEASERGVLPNRPNLPGFCAGTGLEGASWEASRDAAGSQRDGVRGGRSAELR